MNKPITIITATEGRDTLALVAEDVAKQTLGVEWLVVFDGPDAKARGMQVLESCARKPDTVACSSFKLGAHYPLMFYHSDSIETDYICFMDDDNRFSKYHAEIIYQGLLHHPFVSTRRILCDDKNEPIALEASYSEHVDTNTMGLLTDIWLEVGDFWSREHIKSYFCDRQTTAYLCAKGIRPVILPYYTVKYKHNTSWGLGYESLNCKLYSENITGRTVLMPTTESNINQKVGTFDEKIAYRG